jgi:hypothetical protein
MQQLHLVSMIEHAQHGPHSIIIGALNLALFQSDFFASFDFFVFSSSKRLFSSSTRKYSVF